jgi:hypothetical protein
MDRCGWGYNAPGPRNAPPPNEVSFRLRGILGITLAISDDHFAWGNNFGRQAPVAIIGGNRLRLCGDLFSLIEVRA